MTFGAIAAGWLIARTQRTRWNGSVLIYLASYFVVELVLGASMTMAVYRGPHVYAFSERVSLLVEILNLFVVWPAGILLGALLEERKNVPAARSL